MEVMNMAIELIGQVGFPIAVAAYLLYDNRQADKEHKAESEGFITAINNNTNALTRLIEKIERDE